MISVLEKLHSSDGSTKYIFQDQNNRKFEAIYFTLLKEDKKLHFICVSPQVGCAMGCNFCATGYGGFFENLTAEKMLLEVDIIRDDCLSRENSSPHSFNIAVMGMGEPLMNYDNVLQFCHRSRMKYTGLDKIFISTVGITPKILQLAEVESGLNLKLYVSLNSPYNEERIKLMPVAKKFNLPSLISACRYYAEKTESLVKASYLLLKGINDSDQHAHDLATLLDPTHFEAQLLLYNATPDLPYERVSEEDAYRFAQILLDSGIETVVKPSKGQDIGGGCGQLVKDINQKTAKRVSTTIVK